MGTRLVRVGRIYGRDGLIPVSRGKFYKDIVHDDGGAENQKIPGTNIPRLRLTHLGENTRVGFVDEIEALAEALRAARDARPADDRVGATAA